MPASHSYLIPALWLLWTGYWTIAAFGNKHVLRTEGVVSRISHLVPLNLGILLLLFRHAGGPWLAGAMYAASPGSLAAGTALVAAGLGFAAWARIHLAGNWSGTVTLKQDHSLTRSGPYRLVRHPIYTGLLTAILGTTIAEAEWHALLALALITLSFSRKIVIEERFLTVQFGPAYARYQTEVPALLPWPKRGPTATGAASPRPTAAPQRSPHKPPPPAPPPPTPN